MRESGSTRQLVDFINVVVSAEAPTVLAWRDAMFRAPLDSIDHHDARILFVLNGVIWGRVAGATLDSRGTVESRCEDAFHFARAEMVLTAISGENASEGLLSHLNDILGLFHALKPKNNSKIQKMYANIVDFCQNHLSSRFLIAEFDIDNFPKCAWRCPFNNKGCGQLPLSTAKSLSYQ